ncbi:hypothetical protein CYMTET_15261, partial [Cymbomonas tetramitiformis]
NAVGDAGAEALAAALRDAHCKLHTLDITNNDSANTFVKPPLSGWGMIATILQQHRRDGRLTQLLHLTAYWMTYLHI